MHMQEKKNMSEIKIFVSHTPNSHHMRVQHPLMYPVIAGSDFQTEQAPQGMLRDNEGIHISYKNKSYCELTTQYWAWKNECADYFGFCHYRRFFSFFPGKLKEADCGCVMYPFLDEKTQAALRMDESSMRKYIEKYDVLIAKGIPVNALRSKSVYEHYQNAAQLHVKDLDLLLDIINEKYPKLAHTAQSYVHGKIFYPCNMFIMKKQLFDKYSKLLFAVLDEFEKRSDMSNYSREGIRTPGHLGERMAGIFYSYLKEQGKYRLGELQIVQIGHTDEETICSSSNAEDDSIPIVLAANQHYVPVLYTCIKSLTDYASDDRNYKIYVFHIDIEQGSRKEIQKLQRQNIKIIFVHVAKNISRYHLKAKGHISAETYYRFLILDILTEYPKAIYLDCDTIVRYDLSKLYEIPMGDCLLGAVADPDFAGQYYGANPDTRQYCDEILKLKEPASYFQAGVLVFNINACKKELCVKQLLQMAETGIYKYSDQDILNIVCEGRVRYLDMAWNVLTNGSCNRWHQVIKYAPSDLMDAYEKAREQPFIIHYAGTAKPWDHLKDDFAKEFWLTARTTPYYEELIYNLCNQRKQRRSFKIVVIDALRKLAKKILPQGSWIRRTAGTVYWKFK